MASNPPLFQVEDNSDDDFFDKLVNDDDDVDFKITASSESGAPVFADGNESDEAAQAFANLNINELDSNGDFDFGNISGNNLEAAKDLSAVVEKVGIAGEVGHVQESGNHLVASDSFAFDNLVEKAENENGESERSSDATVVSKSSDDALSDQTIVTKNDALSGAPGVKEVEWSAFHADPAENDISGFGSYSDFFGEFESGSAVNAVVDKTSNYIDNGPQLTVGNNLSGFAFVGNNSDNNVQQSDVYNNAVAADLSASTHDQNNSEYWENQYPGWKYDPNTGQWYQIDGYDASSSMQADAGDHTSAWGVADAQNEVSYLQQSAQSVSGSVAEMGRTVSLSNWNQGSLVSDASDTSNQNQFSHVSSQNDAVSSDWNQGSQDNVYPSHMVFDPQYPGWYYDTIANEWRDLESYVASVQSTSQVQGQANQDVNGSAIASSQHDGQETYISHGLGDSYNSQGFDSQVQDQKWAGGPNELSSSMWQPGAVANDVADSLYSRNQLIDKQSGQNMYMNAHSNQQNSVQQGVRGSYYATTSQSPNDFSRASPSQSFAAAVNSSHNFNDPGTNQNDQRHFFNDYYNINNSVNFSQQHVQSAKPSYSPAAGRSSAGRPAHALVTFGFGGKLIVMKDTYSTSFGTQNPAGGSISVLNLAEVAHNVNASTQGIGSCNYFEALCQQPAPGPLTGGSVGIKELNKWIDERISNLGSPYVDYRKAEVLKLLLSLLKIACQYYGKLRHPYGTDAALKESDTPESAVAKLFASAKGSRQQFHQYGAVAQCLQQMPSEGQLRATASEVQDLLVSGRKKEALQCAQEGQLWGPALVLAAQLGDQFYVETVKQMALRQLSAGSPLRTLCLLIAGQPADVFSTDSTVQNNKVGPLSMPQQPAHGGANNMLDDWEENLAVITANRTKDDELVLIHLGDCLWKDRSDIIAAHICYLVAEASFEPFSDSARLCLVGADHLKHPRTYASPEAIQRTEIYEHSKTLGNSQFILLPFQPYKLIYAHMLAEVGRINEALKYCQAVLKSLKAGRNPEAENLRHLVSSLEERIKAHQQGGFSTKAPKEFIGKLLNLFDSTAHRVVGGLPPPIPTSGAVTHGNENHHQSMGPRVSTSQSTLAMSSLVPSQSMEPISEWAADGSKMSMHTRSVSEPDFGRSPRQADSKNPSSTVVQDKSSATGTSRFGRFGFGSSLLQKTVGLVLKPYQGRQAKLGDSNKFYYDERLKRWVEEGAEPPAEETALPPPPTTATFQNGTPDYASSRLHSEPSLSNGIPDIKSPSSTLDNSSGMPPLPPTTGNQYSARGRMGVRSRYVDTFNQGGGKAASLFQSPPVPATKPASSTGANPKFFVPSPVSSTVEHESHPVDATTQSTPTMDSPLDNPVRSSHAPPNPTMPIQRFASMHNIKNNMAGENSSFMAHSRRTASWSGSLNGSFSPPQKGEVKPLGEVLGMHPSSFMQNNAYSSPMNDGGVSGDDLHEVEL